MAVRADDDRQGGFPTSACAAERGAGSLTERSEGEVGNRSSGDELSMIVVTTSWAPVTGLEEARDEAPRRAGDAPATRATVIATTAGGVATAAPTAAAAIAPVRYWPWTPTKSIRHVYVDWEDNMLRWPMK